MRLDVMRLDVMRPGGGGSGFASPNPERFDPPAQRTRSTIADTGTGIAPEVLRALFEPFVRNKGETGTGLRLWGTREIVKKNGWRIGARSCWMVRQSGTVFSILIPQLDTHGSSRRSGRSAKLKANFSGQIQEVVKCGYSEWQLVVC